MTATLFSSSVSAQDKKMVDESLLKRIDELQKNLQMPENESTARLQKQREAIEKKELEKHKQLAMKGYVQSAVRVGDQLLRGTKNIKQDVNEAIKWFMIGAEKGDQFALAQLEAIIKKPDQAISKEQVDELTKFVQECQKKRNTPDALAIPLSLRSNYILAKNGDPHSQSLWGQSLIRGNIVAKDIDGGIAYLRKAAEKGEKLALSSLSNPAFSDLKDKISEEEALKWQRKSAEFGDAGEQYSLATKYQEGIGVAQDKNEALKWFQMIVINTENTDDHLRNLAKQEINKIQKENEAKQKENELIKAAEAGDANAALQYAQYLLRMKEKEKSQQWFLKAAEGNNVDAQIHIANTFYSEGKTDEALKWYRKAADQNNAIAIERIDSIEKSEARKVVDNLRKSANNGDVDSMMKLGELTSTRKVGQEEDAVTWYTMAAEKGNVEAMEILAEFALTGIGSTRPNEKKYHYWLDQAVKSGSKKAKEQLDAINAKKPRQWQLRSGKEFEADFISLDGDKVFFFSRKLSQQLEEKFKDLCEEDQDHIRQLSSPFAVKKKKQEAADVAAAKTKIDWKTPLHVLLAEAGRNNPDALAWIGYAYETGTNGLQKNHGKAKEYYQRGKEHPDADSPTVQYCKGHYFGKDMTGSSVLLRRSADQGFVLAQFEMGTKTEWNVDYVRSCTDVAWLSKAAEQGYIPAIVLIGNYYGGQSQQIISGHWNRDSDAWFRELAIYEPKYTKVRDANLALKYWQAAAKKGSSEALIRMGVLYTVGNQIGYNIKTDTAEAIICFTKADVFGDRENKHIIWLLNKIIAEEPDVTKKIRERANSGDTDAQFALGWFYLKGFGGPKKDAETAVTWFRKAAEKNNPYAQYKLAKCYEEGTGVIKDQTEANKWFLKAAEQEYLPKNFSPNW
ncbi:MAG: hypothetical protein LBG58_13865 [Planctomycetaceae bacterium]|nr:hypothetical protein [Planctomycetaceae bacterium]